MKNAEIVKEFNALLPKAHKLGIGGFKTVERFASTTKGHARLMALKAAIAAGKPAKVEKTEKPKAAVKVVENGAAGNGLLTELSIVCKMRKGTKKAKLLALLVAKMEHSIPERELTQALYGQAELPAFKIRILDLVKTFKREGLAYEIRKSKGEKGAIGYGLYAVK